MLDFHKKIILSAKAKIIALREKKLKIKFDKIIILSLIFVGLVVVRYYFYPAFASPPNTPYAPGETIDPACSPGDENCTVYPPLSSTLTTSTALTMGTYSLRFAHNTANYTSFTVAADGSLTIGGNVSISGLTNLANTLTFTMASGTSITATNALLVSATTTNLYVSGNVNLPNDSISDGMVVNSLTASNYLLLTGGTLSGGLIFTTAGGTMITSTNLYVSNKIGINSSTPSASLAIQGVAGTNPLIISSSTNAQLFAVRSDGQVVVGPNSLSQTGQLTIETPTTNDIALSFTNGAHYTFQLGRVAGTSGQAFIGGPSGTSLHLRAGGTDRVFINNITGNVGVVSSTPNSTFVVKGVGGINPFAITSSTNAHFLTVLQSGNVGIGTSTPTQKLSVVGNISNIIDSGTTISLVASSTITNSPDTVFVSGRYAYVGHQQASSNLTIIDISNPLSPITISLTTVGGVHPGINVSGRYA